jgi:hypothetical protein
MALFDTIEQKPPSKVRRYFYTAVGVIVTIVVFVAAFPSYLWYPFVYYREERTVRQFLAQVIAGNSQQAYQIWKPSESYTFARFNEDWGPYGYYGPVKSYRMERPEHIKGGAIADKGAQAADVIVDVSPDQPFPADDDVAKQHRVKQVHLWVEFDDQAISFPPY